jgi:tRNA threonylcarbamoyladenosine biosynthesis protein TsaB
MRLAIETATDRASIAVGRSAADAVERDIAGARRHAAALLPLIGDALREAGTTLAGLTAIVLSDGPGSFTGLRVGAAVAKALVRARDLPLWIAPSLLVRASGVAREGVTVLAVTDALRGDLYAAVYRFTAGGIITQLAPAVVRPDALMAGPLRPDVLVGDAPSAAADALERWAGIGLVRPPEGAPHARALLGLVGRAGGAVRVEAVQGWAPAYGRPAEAQARWETTHGRSLPDSVGTPG